LERTENLFLFRDYKITELSDSSPPILVCTDLASRGLDIPNITVIVQLQFASNVVAHLHRMGRCGRAGLKNGRGIIFYSSLEKDLVNVVRDAELHQEQMVLEKDVIDEENFEKGKIEAAFSRRRGFRNKFRKRMKQEES